MNITDFLGRLEGVRKTPSGWDARCPAHEDGHASLSVAAIDSGMILLHCHAGCDPGAVVGKLGLTMRDLMPSRNGNGKPREIVATYDYQDAAGQLVFQVVRFCPKDFRQRRPDGQGGWVWNLKGIERVPYRLPELLAADPAETVWIPEGENDVDRLASLGLTATCNPGGAGKWRREYGEHFRGRRVVVLPDNDGPGRKHGQDVAKSLSGTAASVRVLELPGLPDKGDVSDWLANRGTVDELVKLVEVCPKWNPPKGADGSSLAPRPHQDGHERPTERFRLTDMGNSQRLAKLHGNDLRYCWPWGKWLVWDGRRWKMDDTGTIAARAKATVRSIYTEASRAEDDAERKTIAGWARQSEKRERISAMVDLARSEPGIPVLPAELDRDPWLLNCANGTLDLRTAKLREHSQADYLTKLCPTPFDPTATPPRWTAFQDRIFAGDVDLIRFIKRLAGYCLTGSVRDHVLPVLWGVGSNGKSTFIGGVMDTMGPDFAMKAPRDMLMIRRGEHHPTELTDLHGKRLVAATETAEGQRLDEALVKDLTGSDPIRGRRMYENFWEFRPTHKLILATNHRPEIRDTTHSTWRRVKLIPFTVVIPDREQDHDLPEKLRAEAPGILAWAVDGCLEWQADGLAEAQAVKVATSEYRSEQDMIGAFIDECCQTGPHLRERAGTLYGCYRDWCKQNGEREVNQTRFGKALTEKGYDREKVSVTWYKGIALLGDDHE